MAARSKGQHSKPGFAKPGPVKAGPGTLPSKEDILTFIQSATETVGKREIARAFSIKGDNRVALKQLLQEMTEAGQLSGNRTALQEKGRLPAVATFDIVGMTRKAT